MKRLTLVVLLVTVFVGTAFATEAKSVISHTSVNIVEKGKVLRFNLSSGASLERAEIFLLDMHGSIIKEAQIRATEGTIDLNNLSHGFYFIKVRLSSGEVISRVLTIP